MDTLVQADERVATPTSPSAGVGPAALIGLAAGRALLGISGILALVAAWEIVSRLELVRYLFISRPSDIAVFIYAGFRDGDLGQHFFTSLFAYIVAFGLAASAGISLGLLVGYFQVARDMIEWLLWFLYATPLIVFYPLLIMSLGLGPSTVVAISFLIAFFPIALTSAFAVRSTDPTLLRCAKSFCANNRQSLLMVIIPAAVPVIVAGLRFAAGPAMVGVVLGEFLASDRGIGFLISDYGRRLQTTGVLGVVLLGALVAVVNTTGLRALEGRLSRWRAHG